MSDARAERDSCAEHGLDRARPHLSEHAAGTRQERVPTPEKNCVITPSIDLCFPQFTRSSFHLLRYRVFVVTHWLPGAGTTRSMSSGVSCLPCCSKANSLLTRSSSSRVTSACMSLCGSTDSGQESGRKTVLQLTSVSGSTYDMFMARSRYNAAQAAGKTLSSLSIVSGFFVGSSLIVIDRCSHVIDRCSRVIIDRHCLLFSRCPHVALTLFSLTFARCWTGQSATCG